MTTAHALHRGHERLKPLIDLALKEGWRVVQTSSGNLRFIKQGSPSIYIGSTALRRPGHRPVDNTKGGLGANG